MLAICLVVITYALSAQRGEAQLGQPWLELDDPCTGAGEEGSCSSAFLQMGLQGRSLRQLHTETREEPRDEAPSAQLESLRKALKKGQKGADARQWVKQYLSQIEKEVIPSLTSAQKLHKQLLQDHFASFHRCDADLEARQKFAALLQTAVKGWTQLHEECTAKHAMLQKHGSDCRVQLSLAQQEAQKHCAKAQGEEQSRACEDALLAVEAQEQHCAKHSRLVTSKATECDMAHASVKSADCARATQMSGICHAYAACRSGMDAAYHQALDAATAWQESHKEDWLAIQSLRCFSQKLGPDSLHILEQCGANAGVKLLDAAQASPPQQPCQVPPESPCAAQSGPLQARRLPASFFQSSMETSSEKMPGGVRAALFGALVTPAALLVVAVTFLAAVGRSMMIVTPEVEERKSLCLSSGASFGNAPRGSLGASQPGLGPALDFGRWLCPELVVPKSGRCQVHFPALREMSFESGSPSFPVMDKLGQPLLRASLLRLAEPDPRRKDVLARELLSLTRHDGTVLATCRMTRFKAQSGSRVECEILQRDGKLFASLATANCSWTWMARFFPQRVAPTSASEIELVFQSASPGLWSLRVQSSCTTRSPSLTVLDQEGRLVAAADRGAGGPQRALDLFRAEVSNQVETDLGLITTVLLSSDRLFGWLANRA